MNTNNTSNNRLVCFIGRCQPYTVAHHAAVTKALSEGSHALVILGSAFAPRNPKNPWTFRERADMIRASFSKEDNDRLTIRGVADTLYDDMEWVEDVTQQMEVTKDAVKAKSIALIYHVKDDTSYYLNYFKFLELIPFEAVTDNTILAGSVLDVKEQILLEESNLDEEISATTIRELMFNGSEAEELPYLQPSVCAWLKDWMHPGGEILGSEFRYVQEEYDAYVREAEKFVGTPYGVHNHYTADNVVIQSGYVLMVRRAKSPGKGLWALPGGHVNKDEDSFAASIRELREETCLKIPSKVLVGSLFCEKLFDHPNRSLRGQVGGYSNGRSVTVAYGYKLDDSQPLPKVKGRDDALESRWIRISDLRSMRSMIFEDHYSIIKSVVARIPQNRRVPDL